MKFKEGDKVKVSGHASFLGGYKIGDLATCIGDELFRMYDGVEQMNSTKNSCFTLVKSSQTNMEFKKGDIVKVIRDSNLFTGVMPGTIVVVKMLDPAFPQWFKATNGHCYNSKFDELEMVERETPVKREERQGVEPLISRYLRENRDSLWGNWGPSPCYQLGESYWGRLGQYNFSNVPIKSLTKEKMSLKDIPNRLKRMLNANFKAFYRLGWVDEDLDLTREGAKALTNLIFDKFEKELGEVAQSKVKEIKSLEK